jgi:hypothetical protein
MVKREYLIIFGTEERFWKCGRRNAEIEYGEMAKRNIEISFSGDIKFY